LKIIWNCISILIVSWPISIENYDKKLSSTKSLTAEELFVSNDSSIDLFNVTLKGDDDVCIISEDGCSTNLFEDIILVSEPDEEKHAHYCMYIIYVCEHNYSVNDLKLFNTCLLLFQLKIYKILEGNLFLFLFITKNYIFINVILLQILL